MAEAVQRSSNSAIFSVEPVKLLESSLRAVLNDESFQVPSELASKSLQIAGQLLDWCLLTQNQEVVATFADHLTTMLGHCLSVQCSSEAVRKERMWSKYHSSCTSEQFKQEWKYFLNKSVQPVLLPTFYQHLTDLIFKSMVKSNFHQSSIPKATIEVSLTYEEKNALRYTAGRGMSLELSARSLRIKSAHPLKEELVLCLHGGDDRR